MFIKNSILDSFYIGKDQYKDLAKNIYKNSGFVIPVNMEIVDFRPPVRNEMYLSRDGTIDFCLCDNIFLYPRFIVKERIYSYTVSPCTVYGENYKIPEGYEVVRFGYPKLGELILNRYGEVLPNQIVANPSNELPLLILRKTKEPKVSISDKYPSISNATTVLEVTNPTGKKYFVTVEW